MRGIVSFLLVWATILSFSQGPLPPTIRSASVVNESGMVRLQWDHSPDSLSVKKYKIDTLNRNNPLETRTVDSTDNPEVTVWEVSMPVVNYRPVPFSMYAKDIEWGGTSASHTTVFLKISESCESIVLTWTQYKGWAGDVEYRVLVDETEMARKTNADTTYTFHSFTPGQTYIFRIEALNGQSDTASSNHVRHTTYSLEQPQRLEITSVQPGSEGGLQVSVGLDGGGSEYQCRLMRASSSAGPFDEIKDTLMAHDFVWHDAAAPIGVWFYQVHLVDTCGRVFGNSNSLNNMDLTARQEGYEVFLDWNAVEGWPEGEILYTVYGQFAGEAPKPYNTGPNTSTSVGFTSQAGKSQASQVCFYVVANSTTAGDSYNEQSDIECVEFPLRFTYINAFTPNGDGVNEYFIPLSDFAPRDVRLYIYNQAGLPVAEVHDLNGWDGTDGSGRKVSSGVYPYYFKATGYDGSQVEHYGNVTVVYP